jgi:hypothetical protein
MPHPDGVELAKMIRKQPWGKSVHLVALKYVAAKVVAFRS